MNEARRSLGRKRKSGAGVRTGNRFFSPTKTAAEAEGIERRRFTAEGCSRAEASRWSMRAAARHKLSDFDANERASVVKRVTR